jgi:hypothetical protein
MSPNILASRDTNVQLSPKKESNEEKPRSLEYHRQVLESRKLSGQ